VVTPFPASLISQRVESASADLVLVENGVTTLIDLGHARRRRRI
jgi:hypothetical protein